MRETNTTAPLIVVDGEAYIEDAGDAWVSSQESLLDIAIDTFDELDRRMWLDTGYDPRRRVGLMLGIVRLRECATPETIAAIYPLRPYNAALRFAQPRN